MPATKSPSEFTAQVNADWAERKTLNPGGTPEADVIFSLNSNPLGTVQGEAALQTPFNTPRRRPNVYVVNHSRVKERRVCVVPVSSISGAEDALRYKGPKGKEYREAYGNAELLTQAAKRKDMSIYEDAVEPVMFVINFDGRKYVIAPATAEDPNNPPVEAVPDGVWDLYCGNYERMNATKDRGDGVIVPDTKERSEELQRLTLRWSRKHSPVWRQVVNGTPSTSDNPFGFIEFIYEIPKEAPTRVDGAFVTASELAEVE